MLLKMELEPDFPEKDISDETAEILELLLLNRAFIDQSHDGAEQAHILFRLGHQAIDKTARPFMDGDRLAAFSYGVSTYETVRSIVRPHVPATTKHEAGMKVMIMTNALNTIFVDTVTDARDQFTTKLPRTKYVIGQSAARFYSTHVDYALAGAAIAHDLEIQRIPS